MKPPHISLKKTSGKVLAAIAAIFAAIIVWKIVKFLLIPAILLVIIFSALYYAIKKF
jgi:hypothetical protein